MTLCTDFVCVRVCVWHNSNAIEDAEYKAAKIDCL